MTKYAVPHPTIENLQATFLEGQLRFVSPQIDVSLSKSEVGLVFKVGKHSVPVQHDLVGVVSTMTGLDKNVVGPLIQNFLQLNFDVSYANAIPDWLQLSHPALNDFAKLNRSLKIPISLPRRLEEAFRMPNMKTAAANYWQETACGPSATRTFSQCLVLGNDISELKVSWLGLVPSTLRHELADIELKNGGNSFPLMPECRSLFTELAPRTIVEVVKNMMSDPSLPLVIAAGQQLGYKMTGRDPIRIIGDLREFVRTNGFGRCRDLGEYLTKRGLHGHKVTQIYSAPDLVIAASSLKNCLNNPSQPYRHGVMSGRYRIFCIGENWNLGALAFDPTTWKLVEAKGFHNSSLPDEISNDLTAAITEWGQING
jgi:hypothetical protein